MLSCKHLSEVDSTHLRWSTKLRKPLGEGEKGKRRTSSQFHLKGKANVSEELKGWLVKKGSEQVDEDSITPAKRPQWRQADGEEWEEVFNTSASTSRKHKGGLPVRVASASLSSSLR